MIRPEELRIGNWVYVPSTDQIAEITTVHKHMGLIVNNSLAGLIPKDVSPIPLTEEWLINFGFRNGEIFYQKKQYDPYYFKVDLSSEYTDNCYYNHGRATVGFPYTLKYVHQLQNLYFALTQEELTIKQ